MPRTSSRLSAALVLIALLGLSLPASAMGQPDRPGRLPGIVSWLQEWMDSVWSVLVPEAPEHSLTPAIDMDNTSTDADRGILIDPNGGRR
jgi:hypothetical protein